MSMSYLPEGHSLQNRYIIKKVLGQGGFGITYEGFDSRLDTKIAIKEYLPKEIANRMEDGITVSYGEDCRKLFETGLEHFKTEAKNLSILGGNSNIVYVRDYFEENSTCYIIMEFVEGITLKQYITTSGKQSFDDFFEIFEPLMEAIGVLHKNGIIHRDISPENIILTVDKVLKLIDFGATKEISDKVENHTVMFKKGYAPIEQYATVSVLDERTDVYGLAATLYFCITGQIPAAPMDRVSTDILIAPSKLGAVINPVCESALLYGLGLFQENRWKSVSDFIRALKGEQIDYVASSKEGSGTVIQLDELMTDVQNDLTLSDSKEDIQGENLGTSISDSKDLVDESSNRTIDSTVNSDKKENDANNKKRKHGRVKRKNHAFLKIVAVIILAIIVFSVFSNVNKAIDTVNIAGKTFNKDTKSVLVNGAKITTRQLQMIHNLSNLSEIAFENCFLTNSDVEVIAQELSKIPNMSKVSISLRSNMEITDISPLKDIPQIVYLDVSQTSAGDLSCLCELDNLETLLADEMYVEIDKESISKLGNLKGLSVNGNKLVNLDFLKNATQITSLYAADNKLKDISGLSNVEKFYHLEMQNNEISDLSPLSNCDFGSLLTGAVLNISNNHISSLEPLRGNVNYLKEFDASYNSISDISPLEGAVDLTVLCLNDNCIEDVRVLGQMLDLNNIILSNNNISEVSFFKDMQRATNLELRNNKVSDISSWTRDYSLAHLDIGKNNISDISVVENMPKLTSLYVDNNEVVDIAVISSLSELKYLFIHDNKIEDISVMDCFSSDICNGFYKNNNISDFSVLVKFYDDENAKYAERYLNLYGNPNIDLSTLAGMKGLVQVTVSDSDNVDWSRLCAPDENKKIERIIVVGAPKDKQYEIEQICMAYFGHVEFFTLEDYISAKESEQ